MQDHHTSVEAIERTLAGHPGVRHVAVTDSTATSGVTRRVAYVDARPGSSVAARDLMEFLRERLPDNLMPAGVMLLAELPVTPEGGPDLDALPVFGTPGAIDDGHRGARSELEALLCGIFEGVLDLERIDVRDNFFDLGGHSLTAAQVMTRVRESLNVDLPLRTLFDAPTVQSLAESIEEHQRHR